MKDQEKTKEQLIGELIYMRSRISELEETEKQRKQVEEALRESEKRYRSLVEATSGWVWEVDCEGVYTYGTPKIRDLLGYEPEEVLGRKLFDFMLPGERERVARIFHEAVKSKAPLHSILNTNIHKSGQKVDLETSAVPIVDAEGRLLGYRGIDRDITKRKRAGAALVESEKRFSEFMEHLPVGVFIKDETGHLLFANRYLQEFFGWRDCIGRTTEELVLRGVAERMIADDRKVLAEGPMVFQERLADIHGAEHYFETYKFPIEIEGSPTLVAGIRMDITDRKLAEARTTQLSALKEKLIARGALNDKLKLITKAAVQIYDADFARVWITKEGDLCEKGCSHALVTEGPHLCRDRSRCLHLVASSGRYTHLDGNHRRVPLGAYKIGNIATGRDTSFLTNDVTHDPRVHNHAWAETLGLVSLAGFRLISPDGNPIGVLALFKKRPIDPEEMRFLEDLANTTSQVIRASMAEEALRESENRFRSLVLNSSDTITVLAADGTIRYQSPSLKRFFGYDPDDLIGRNVFPYVHPDDLATAQVAFSQILEHPGRSVSVEYRFRHANGSWIFVESVGSSFLDDPSIKGVVLNSRDITERKRAEEKVRLASLYSRSLIEASLDPLVMISPEGRITDVNRATEQVTGVPRESLIGDDFWSYFTEPGKAREGYKKVLSDGLVRDYPLTIRHRAGKTTDVVYNATLYRNEQGEIQGVFAAARDITERKLAEEALLESEQRVRRLNEQILNMVMVLSHDIRGPLIAIASILKLLLRGTYGKLDQSPANTVQDLLFRCARLLGTAEDYLGRASIVEGSIEMEREVLDLRQDIIDAVLDELSEEITKHEIVIDNRLGAIPAGSIVISANKTWLKAVYRNLFSNAVKYGGRGCTISFGFEQHETNYRLNVYNSGKPIAEEDREQLFARFGRIGSSERRAPDGVGLGLCLCKEIIHDHGGEIWYEARPDGSNFVFTISREREGEE